MNHDQTVLEEEKDQNQEKYYQQMREDEDDHYYMIDRDDVQSPFFTAVHLPHCLHVPTYNAARPVSVRAQHTNKQH